MPFVHCLLKLCEEGLLTLLYVAQVLFYLALKDPLEEAQDELTLIVGVVVGC